MSLRPVHWHEGMFLRPHHFQAAERYGQYLSHRDEKWDLHYNWGLRSIDIDLDALANNRLVIRSIKARMPDGTLISIPEDGVPPARDLKTAFEGENNVTVFLAVPVVSLGKSNVSAEASTDGSRYVVDVQQLEDENTGINPQPIEVRALNYRLLFSTEDRSGYEVLPIARIDKMSTAEATPQLDITYIPPLLSCDAWAPLQAGILEQIYDRVGKKLEVLAEQVVSRGIGFDSMAQGEPLLFHQLRMVNEASTLLGTLLFAQGVHPLVSYVELCRLVGQLAILDKDRRRPPELMRYDHDNLGECFYRVKKYIDMLIQILPESEYQMREFIGAGLRMQVAMEPIWLEAIWQMFVGVKTTLGTEDCIRLLTRAGHQGLDMKIGSSERVDEIFRMGEAGLKFAYTSQPPNALPKAPGLAYFQVNRESQLQEWQRVQRSLTMAIRINENLIVGDIQGQKVLRIKAGGQTVPMQFSLYVVPKEK